MTSSHLSAAAAGFLAAPLLSSTLLILLGEGGMTVSVWLDICLVLAGALVAVALRLSRKRPVRHAHMRPHFVMPKHLSERMKEDIGFYNL